MAELNTSFDEYASMSWAEFCIRSHAYRRRELIKLKEIRLLAYANFLANWQSKQKPPTIEKYWPIDNDKQEDKKKTNLEAKKQRFLEATRKFNENRKK